MAAEIFLGPIVEKLLDKLISSSVRYVADLWKVTSQLGKMSKTLSEIQEVLDDAEAQQITNIRIKEWLNKLKHVAYDLEDLVDEFETESLRREVETGASTSLNKQVRIQNIVPSSLRPSVVSFKLKIASRLKKINEKLEQIAKERDDYGLSKRFGVNSITVVKPRAPTSSLPDNSPVFGREKEKEELIQKLLQSDEASDDGMLVTVIPIVGMGGVGKTTLARLLYNDERVNKNFNLKAWAYVSQEFDLVRVTQAILESFATNMLRKNEELESPALGAATDKSHHLEHLDPLQVTLRDKLNGNKFLVVLDDVWSIRNTDWDELQKPFSAGASGSKILVTTRNSNFLKMPIDGAFNHPLKELTNEDGWSLFSHHAFRNRNLDAYPELNEIGKQMVGKCQGLPLAVVTLGRLLKFVENVKEWEKILKSEIWALPADQSDILPALRLSYFHLPSHLKRCFAYCAILPKGFKFQPDFLIPLWIAEGLVKPEQNRNIEDVGREYFDDLSSRSFFQATLKDEWYTMHDLIVELAKFISGEICFQLDDLKPNELINISKHCRHFSYRSEFCEIRTKFCGVYNAKHLRTFFQLRGVPHNSFLARQVPYDLVSSLKYLRVFNLRCYKISELPDSIGNLKHLRYLNLAGTAIKSLPDSICKLHNLQFLYVVKCGFLTELPKDMANLINLRYLSNGDCHSLQKMPIGMYRLRNLKKLSYFVVGNDGGSSIKDLKDMDLEKKIHLSKLQNIVDSRDAQEANFKNKRNLQELTLEWSNDMNEVLTLKDFIEAALEEKLERLSSVSSGDGKDVLESLEPHEKLERLSSVSSGDGKDVLESLEPHEKLETLSIVHYRGSEFPSWVGHSSFSALSFLALTNCRDCRALPSLGQLPSLKELRIVGLHQVKSVGREFYGIDCHKPFRSLEKLTFIDMQEWEEWTGTEELPCLCMLHIERCPKLRRSTQLFPAALDQLKIIDCEELVEFSRDSSLSHDLLQGQNPRASLVISNCPKLIELPRRFLQVGKVDLSNCNEIVTKSDVEISSVTSFRMSRIPMLRCLPLCFLHFLKTIEKLEIDGCNSLTALSEDGFQHLTFLQHLKVSRCPQLTSLLEDEGLPPKLRVLQIEQTAKLEKLPHGLRNLSSLKALHIEDCPALRFFPEGLLCMNSLEDLRIKKCPSLTAITGGGGASLGLATATSSNVRTSKLKFLLFGNCENLESLLEGNNNLRDLERFIIFNCPRIASLPKGLLAATNLGCICIANCHNLKCSLPNRFHDLTSLYQLAIVRSPISIPAEKWFPKNLRLLELGDDNNLWPLSKLGSCLSELTSLELLSLSGFSSVESFPEMMFPTTLQALNISSCANLKSLPKSLHKLTSLEILIITKCPKLAYLPENGLPSSKLGVLGIFDCPQLKLRCQKEKGKDWSKIADIPLVGIDDKEDLVLQPFIRKCLQFHGQLNFNSILQQLIKRR